MNSHRRLYKAREQFPCVMRIVCQDQPVHNAHRISGRIRAVYLNEGSTRIKGIEMPNRSCVLPLLTVSMYTLSYSRNATPFTLNALTRRCFRDEINCTGKFSYFISLFKLVYDILTYQTYET